MGKVPAEAEFDTSRASKPFSDEACNELKKHDISMQFIECLTAELSSFVIGLGFDERMMKEVYPLLLVDTNDLDVTHLRIKEG
eukprot:8599932-Karenia_brevis.AAC.1